jgi:hypothetical protein
MGTIPGRGLNFAQTRTHSTGRSLCPPTNFPF